MRAQHQVLQCASRFVKAGGTVLCILHDMNLAAQYADRVIILSEGKMVANGSSYEVLTPEILRDAFHVESVILHDPNLNHPVVVTQSKSN